MEAPLDPPLIPSGSPYREPPPVTPEPTPRASRSLSFAALALGLLALSVALVAMHLSDVALLRAERRPMNQGFVSSPWRPESHLDTAVQEFARRNHRPLFIAPDLGSRALLRAIAPGSLDGPFRETLRALDAYAATRGLWLHEFAGMLRLEREVTAVDFDCDDTLDACAERLEQVASVQVIRAPDAARRFVHMHLHHDNPAVEATRAALTAAGFQVDVTGRMVSVFLSATERTEASASEPLRIRHLGAGTYVIARDSIDRVLENQSVLMRSTRILPHERDGRVVGVRVFGVRPDSLLGLLGLENGDVLTHINGLDIASPDHCLEAYTRLRTSDRFTLEVERGSRRLALTYLIV